MSGRKKLAPARRSPRLHAPPQPDPAPDSGREEEEEDTPSSEDQQQSQGSTDSPAVDSPASSQSPAVQGGTYLEQVHIFTSGLLRQQPQAGPQQQQEEEASLSAGDASSQDSRAGSGRQALSNPESSQGAALSTPSPLSIFGEHGTTKSQLSVGDSTIDYLAPILQGDETTADVEPAEPEATALAADVTTAITLSDGAAVASQPETKRHFDFASKGIQENAPATVGASLGSAMENVAELVPTSGPNVRAQQTAQSSSIQTFSSLTMTRSSTSLGLPDPTLPAEIPPPVLPTYGEGQLTTQMDTPSSIVCPPNCSDETHRHPVRSLGGPSDFGPGPQLQGTAVSGPSAFLSSPVAAYTQQSPVMPPETPVLPAFSSWAEARAYATSTDSDAGSGSLPGRQAQFFAVDPRSRRQRQLPATLTSSSADPYEQPPQVMGQPTTQQGVRDWQWPLQHNLPRASGPSQQIAATFAAPRGLVQLLQEQPSYGIHQFQQGRFTPTSQQLLPRGPTPRHQQQHLWAGPSPRIHQQHLQAGRSFTIHHKPVPLGPLPRIQYRPIPLGPLPGIHQQPQHLGTRFLQGPTQAGPSAGFLQGPTQAGPSAGFLQGPTQAGPSAGFLQGPTQAGPSAGFLQGPTQVGPVQGVWSPQAHTSRATHTSHVYHPGQQARPLSAPPPRTKATPPRNMQSRSSSVGTIGVEHPLGATSQAFVIGTDTGRYTPYQMAGRHGHISSESSPERPATRSLAPALHLPPPMGTPPRSVVQQGEQQLYLTRSASDSHLADFAHRARHYLPPEDFAREMEAAYGFRRRGVRLSLFGSPLPEGLSSSNPNLRERVPGASPKFRSINLFIPGEEQITTPTIGVEHQAEQRSSDETDYSNIPGEVQTRHGSVIPASPAQQTTVTGSLPQGDKSPTSPTVQEQLPTGVCPVERATEFTTSATSSQSTSEKLLLQEQEVSSTSTFVPTAGPSGVAHKRQMGGELFQYQHKMRKAEPTGMVRSDQHRTESLGMSQQGGRVKARPGRNLEGRSDDPTDKHLEGIPTTAEESSETEEEDSEVQNLQNR